MTPPGALVLEASMESLPLWLPFAFFGIALLYSTVGFGGGSSYLALLVAAGLSYKVIPPLALICNLVVVTGGLYHFWRGGHLNLHKVLPFVILSIPMAYVGGSIVISEKLFSLLLGLSLLAAAIRLILPAASEVAVNFSPKKLWMMGLPMGGLLGFLAGLVGIGGGIFLSPVLLLLRLATIKEAAACASLFIFVNSVSGLIGQSQKGVFSLEAIIPLTLAVLLGGQIGSRLGSFHIPRTALAKVLALLVLAVSIKLIMGAV